MKVIAKNLKKKIGPKNWWTLEIYIKKKKLVHTLKTYKTKVQFLGNQIDRDKITSNNGLLDQTNNAGMLYSSFFSLFKVFSSLFKKG